MHYWLLAILIFTLSPVALLGCAPAKETGSGDWVRHQNPIGFTVLFPEGGRVEASGESRVTVMLAEGNGFFLAQPFLMSVSLTSEEYLKAIPERFSGVFPQAKILRIASPRPNISVAEIGFQRNQVSARAIVLCSTDGATGMVYAIAAPAATFAIQRPILSRVATSFTYTETRVGSSGTPPSFTRWIEPNEGMFSVEAPAGWTLSGGFLRHNDYDTRMGLTAEKENNAARIVIGDKEIPPYCLLTPQGEAFGLKEGQPFDVGIGTTFTLRRYQPGLDYAREYVQNRLAAAFPNVIFTATREIPILAAELEKMTPPVSAGMKRERSVGAVEFEATAQGKPWRGYCLAGTVQTQLTGTRGGIWTVEHLYGYIAEAEQENETVRTLHRMVRSLQIEDEWLARQVGISPAFGADYLKTNQTIAGSLQGQLRALKQTDTASNMTFAMTQYADPSGESFRRTTSGNVYWQRAEGQTRSVDLAELAMW